LALLKQRFSSAAAVKRRPAQTNSTSAVAIEPGRLEIAGAVPSSSGKSPARSGSRVCDGRVEDGSNQKVAARLQVGPNCLLFFVDETGHETFADKNYPVFGLGGCAINSSSAAAVIAAPSRAMKAAHFGGEDIPLHANELRNPSTEQLDALSKFFREQQFARLAVTMSKSAMLPTGKTPLEIITGSMMNRYADLLRRVRPSRTRWQSCMRLQIGWMKLSNNILAGWSPRSTVK